MNFYVDHLAVQDDSGTLPRAVLSSLDGRLDMVMGILADSYEFTQEDIRRRRADSVRNVKGTNGRLSFEQKVHTEDGVEDEWLD